MIGWLVWKAMYVVAVLGAALVTLTFILFVWFMFDVGFAWVAVVVIGLVSLLLFFAVRNRGKGFDIRR